MTDLKYILFFCTILFLSSCEKAVKKEKIVLPINPRTGKQRTWPKPRSPQRKGGLD